MVREWFALARHLVAASRVPSDQRFTLHDDRHARARETKFFTDDSLRLTQHLASDATRLHRWLHRKHADISRIASIINANARHQAAMLFGDAYTRTWSAHDLRDFVFVGALTIKEIGFRGPARAADLASVRAFYERNECSDIIIGRCAKCNWIKHRRKYRTRSIALPTRRSNSENVQCVVMTPRLHHLDALRAFAMLLGIVLHAALSFSDIPWTVNDIHRSGWFTLAFLVIHGFRMPLFFMLSGFLTAMLCQRRGVGGLIAQRRRRLLLPLAISCVTIIPVTWFVVIWAKSRQVSEPVAEAVSAAATEPTGTALQVVEFLLFQFPVLQHVWFLWFLCLLTGGFAIAAVLLRGLPTFRVPECLVATPLVFIWLIPLTMLAQSPMARGGTDPSFGPDTSCSVIPMWPVLAYYALFFGFGALLYSVPNGIGRIGRGWPVWLGAAVIVFPFALSLSVHAELATLLIPDPTARHVLALLGQSMYAWLMIFGLTGLCQRTLHRERPVVRYLADSAYWLYLAHLPLVVAGQALVAGIDLPAAVKFLFLVTASLALLLASYSLAVRNTWIGRMLG